MASPVESLDPPQGHLPDGLLGPRLWLLLRWTLRPCELMDTCARRYGHLFSVHWTLAPAVMVSRPEGVQQIFRADPAVFDIGQQNTILQPLVGDNSLLLLDGDRHQRQRQLLMPPLHGERMRAYGELIAIATRQILDTHASGHPFEVRRAMQQISLRVILQAVFGLTEGERYSEVETLLTAILSLTDSPLKAMVLFVRSLQRDWGAWSPWGKFLRLRQELDQLLYEEMGDRRTHPNPEAEDILSLLMAARDENGDPMTDVELRDELVTLLLAGHETTASALAWAFYWIHHTPTILDQLRAELATVDPCDHASLVRLPYLNAICQETLRIYPIVPITSPRFTRQPFEVMGHWIPPNTLLFPCIYLLHRQPDLYPDPETFRPERFLERQFSPYEFIPFGGGNRRCAGMAFALYEMKLVLATALRHVSLEFVGLEGGDRRLKPVRRGVTLAPPPTLQMRVTGMI